MSDKNLMGGKMAIPSEKNIVRSEHGTESALSKMPNQNVCSVGPGENNVFRPSPPKE